LCQNSVFHNLGNPGISEFRPPIFVDENVEWLYIQVCELF
jgi:hypothetical protein